jgi:hypothetical protein
VGEALREGLAMRTRVGRQERLGTYRGIADRLGIEWWKEAERARRHAFVWDLCAVQAGLPCGFFMGLMVLAGEPATTMVSYWRGVAVVGAGIVVGGLLGYGVGVALWGVDGWWRRG